MCERVDEFVNPGPAGGDAESGASSAAGDDPGGVEEAVAEPFRFGAGEFTVEAEQFGPGDEVLRDEHELEPCSG